MKRKFYNKLIQLVTEANTFIHNSVKEGQIIILIEHPKSKDDIERFENQVFDKGVCVDDWDKYGLIAGEYGVVSVEKMDGTIILHTYGKGEETGINKDFTFSQVRDNGICVLADQIAEKLLQNKA